MIESFAIKNFRGFSDFELAELARVNLITGANNVGKTALLEALYLNLASTTALSANLESNFQESATKHYLFRGFKDVAYSLDNVTRWGWLFHDKNLTQDIKLTSSLRDGRTKLTMGWWIPNKAGDLPLTDDFVDDSQSVVLKVHVERIFAPIQSTGSSAEQEWLIHKSGSQSPDRYLRDSLPLRLLFSLSTRSPQDDTKWFSKLADVGRQDEVVTVLKLIDPRLRSLAVSTSEGPPMIYGDIGIGRRVPISQMGEGMVRLLSIVLEIANAPGGVVLIDEIENGLHHSVLTRVWRAIGAAARQADAQVFATTHSWECIKAAHEAFVDNGVYDFHLHRIDRVEGKLQAVTYNQQTLQTSVEMNLEVR